MGDIRGVSKALIGDTVLYDTILNILGSEQILCCPDSGSSTLSRLFDEGCGAQGHEGAREVHDL